MAEKLLTLKEAAASLRVSEEKMRHLVEEGNIPAYQIGGMYLRFKEEQILSLKERLLREGSAMSEKKVEAGLPERGSLFSGIKDFFYFNDFYIISALFIAGLICIILNSIR